MAIHVGIAIRTSIDEVWRVTQTPEQHERWDLRFTTIEYLPRDDDALPQRFRYATRLGFGLAIQGWGETVGTREKDGTRTSALRFGSDDRASLIREGSGYWKYEQRGENVRFVTGYDYEVRYGALGQLVDRALFRPLIGWATAWSFDRLRLWLERGIDPASSARQALAHGLATIGVALVWCWHGLVPKLLGPHADELAMLVEAGVARESARGVALGVGALEVPFAVAVLVGARQRWPFALTIAAMLAALIGVAATSPERLGAAFGPVSLNVATALLAAVALATQRDLPSARRCARKPDEREEAIPA